MDVFTYRFRIAWGKIGINFITNIEFCWHTQYDLTKTKTEEPIWRLGKSRDLKSSCRVSTNQRPVFPVHRNWTNDSTVQIKLKCTFSGYSEYWIYSPLNSNARSGHSVSRESVESTGSRDSAGTTAMLCPPPTQLEIGNRQTLAPTDGNKRVFLDPLLDMIHKISSMKLF